MSGNIMLLAFAVILIFNLFIKVMMEFFRNFCTFKQIMKIIWNLTIVFDHVVVLQNTFWFVSAYCDGLSFELVPFYLVNVTVLFDLQI